VDYLMTDPSVQTMCKLADVTTDSCSIAFLDAKISCGKQEDKNVFITDVVDTGEDYNFAKQFFEKVEEKTSFQLNCNHLDLMEYGNHEETHSQELEKQVNDLRETLRNMVVEEVTVPDVENDAEEIDTEAEYTGDVVEVPPETTPSETETTRLEQYLLR
tara:strand:- start:73 stop:549 length:477 start_codon:yes stop_codon:yes gene_type:complete